MTEAEWNATCERLRWLGEEWRKRAESAEAFAKDRASEADACHEIMAECRKIAGDPHTGTVDAVRGLLARAEKAEAALAKRDTPCVYTVTNGRLLESGCATSCGEWLPVVDYPSAETYPFCLNCGHPIVVQP